MKKSKLTKILSLFLALLVVMGTIPPVTVSAANNMQSNPTGGSNTGGTVPNYVSSETMWKVHIYIGKKDTTDKDTKLTGGNWYKVGKKDILITDDEDLTWTNYLFCDDNKVEYLNASTDYTKVNHSFAKSSSFICLKDPDIPDAPLSGNNSTATKVKSYFGSLSSLRMFLKYIAYTEGYSGNEAGVKEMLSEVVYNPKNKAKISNPDYVIDSKTHKLSTWQNKKDANGNTITAYPTLNSDKTKMVSSFEFLIVYEPIVITRWPGGYGINYSGKTYNRAGFTATDFIVLQSDGLTITNLGYMYYYTGSSAFLEYAWVGYEKSTANEYYKGMGKDVVYKKGGWGMRNAGNRNNSLKDYAVDVSVSPSTVKPGGEVTATFKITNALGDKASIPTKIYARIHKSGNDYYWYDLSKLTKITKTNYNAVGTWKEVRSKLADTDYSVGKGKDKTVTKTVNIDSTVAEGASVQFGSFINLSGYTNEYNPGIRTYTSDLTTSYGNNYDLKSVKVGSTTEISPQITVQLKDNTGGLESVEGKRFGVWAWYSYINGTKTNYDVATATSNGFLGVITTDASGKGTLDLTDVNVSGSNRTATTKGRVPSGKKDNVTWAYTLTGNGNLFSNTTKGNVFSFYNPNNSNSVTAYNADGSIKTYTAKLNHSQVSGSYPTQHILTGYYNVTSGNGKNDLSIYNTLPKQYGNIFSKEKGNLGENHYAIVSYVIRPIEETDNDAVYYTYKKSGTWYNVDAYTTNKNGNGFQKYQTSMSNIYYTVSSDYISSDASANVVADTGSTATLTMYKKNPTSLSSADANKQLVYRDFANGYFSTSEQDFDKTHEFILEAETGNVEVQLKKGDGYALTNASLENRHFVLIDCEGVAHLSGKTTLKTKDGETYGTVTFTDIRRGEYTIRPLVLGDVNFNGKINTGDIDAVKDFIADGLTKDDVGSATFEAMDCNNDGKITSSDVDVLTSIVEDKPKFGSLQGTHSINSIYRDEHYFEPQDKESNYTVFTYRGNSAYNIKETPIKLASRSGELVAGETSVEIFEICKKTNKSIDPTLTVRVNLATDAGGNKLPNQSPADLKFEVYAVSFGAQSKKAINLGEAPHYYKLGTVTTKLIESSNGEQAIATLNLSEASDSIFTKSSILGKDLISNYKTLGEMYAAFFANDPDVQIKDSDGNVLPNKMYLAVRPVTTLNKDVKNISYWYSYEGKNVDKYTIDANADSKATYTYSINANRTSGVLTQTLITDTNKYNDLIIVEYETGDYNKAVDVLINGDFYYDYTINLKKGDRVHQDDNKTVNFTLTNTDTKTKYTKNYLVNGQSYTFKNLPRGNYEISVTSTLDGKPYVIDKTSETFLLNENKSSDFTLNANWVFNLNIKTDDKAWCSSSTIANLPIVFNNNGSVHKTNGNGSIAVSTTKPITSMAVTSGLPECHTITGFNGATAEAFKNAYNASSPYTVTDDVTLTTTHKGEISFIYTSEKAGNLIYNRDLYFYGIKSDGTEVELAKIAKGTNLGTFSGSGSDGITWEIRRKASDLNNANGYSSLTGTISNININNTTKYVAYRLEIKESNGYRQHFIEGPTDEVIAVSELRKSTNHKAENEEIHALGPYKYVYIDSATMLVRISTNPLLKDTLDIEKVANGVTFDFDYFGTSYEDIETITGQSSYTFTGLRNTTGIDFVTNFYRVILKTLDTEKYYLYTSNVTGADRFRETDDAIKGYKIKTDKNDMIDVNFVIGAYGTVVVNLSALDSAWMPISKPHTVKLIRNDGAVVETITANKQAIFEKIKLEGYSYTIQVASCYDCHEWVYPATITQNDFLVQKDNNYTVNVDVKLKPICTGTIVQELWLQDPENPSKAIPIQDFLPYEQYCNLIYKVEGKPTGKIYFEGSVQEGTNQVVTSGIDISKTANDSSVIISNPVSQNDYLTLVTSVSKEVLNTSLRKHTENHTQTVIYTYKLKYDGKITVNLTASSRLQPKDGENYLVTLTDTTNGNVYTRQTIYKSGYTSSVTFYNLPNNNYVVEIEEAKKENQVVYPSLIQENIKINQTVDYELYPTGKIIAKVNYDAKPWDTQLENLSVRLTSKLDGYNLQQAMTDSSGQAVFDKLPIVDDVIYNIEGVDLDVICNIHKNEFGSVKADDFTSANDFTVTKTQTITTPCVGVYEINFENLSPAYADYYEGAQVYIASTKTSNGTNVTIADENGYKYRTITGETLSIPFDISGKDEVEYYVVIYTKNGAIIFDLVDGVGSISAADIRSHHDDLTFNEDGEFVDNYTHTVSATYRLGIGSGSLTVQLEEMPSVWLDDYTTKILIFDREIESFEGGYFAGEASVVPMYEKEITRNDIRNYSKVVSQKGTPEEGQSSVGSAVVTEKVSATSTYTWKINKIDISEEAETKKYYIYVINTSEEYLEKPNNCDGCCHEWSAITPVTTEAILSSAGKYTVKSNLSSKCNSDLKIKFTDNKYTDETEQFTVEVYAYDYDGNLVRNPEAYLNTESQDSTIKDGQFYYSKTAGNYYVADPSYKDSAYEANRFLPQQNFQSEVISDNQTISGVNYTVAGFVRVVDINDTPKYDYYYSYPISVKSNETVDLKKTISQLGNLTGIEKRMMYTWKNTTVSDIEITNLLLTQLITINAYRYPEVISVTTEEVPVTYKYVIKSSSGDVYYYDEILTNKKEVDTDFSDFVNASHSIENETHSITREFQRGTPKEFKVEIKKNDDKSYWYTVEVAENRPVLNLNDVGSFNQLPELNDNGSAITYTDIRQSHNSQNIAEFTDLDITGSAPDNYYFAPVVKLDGIEPEHENCFKFTEIEPVSTEELREEGVVQREYTLYSDCYGVITGRVSVPSYINPLEVKIAVEGKESKYYTYLDENGNYELRLPIDGTSDLNDFEDLTIYYQEEKLDKFYSNSGYYYNFIFEDGSNYTYDKYGNGYNAFECGLEWLRRQEHICDGGEYNDAHKIVCNALISNDSKEIELSVTHLIDEEFVDTSKFHPLLAVDICDKATGYVYFSSRNICESDNSCLQRQSLSFNESFTQTVPRGVDLIVKAYHLNYDFDSDCCDSYNNCRCKLGEIYNEYGELAFEFKENTTLEVTTDVDDTVDVINIDFTTRANWYVCTDICFDSEDEAVVKIVNDYLASGNYSYSESWEEYDENSDSYEETIEGDCKVSDDIVDKRNGLVTVSTLANAQKKPTYWFNGISFNELEQKVEALNESLPADANYYYQLSYSGSAYYFNTYHDLSIMDVPFPVSYNDFLYAKDYTAFYTISIDKIVPSQTGNLTVIIEGDKYLSEKDNVEFDFALFVPNSYANEYHVLSAVENNSITFTDIPVGEYSIEHNDNFIYENTAHWSYLTSRVKSEDGTISHSVEVKPNETTVIEIHITADWYIGTKFTDLDGGNTAGIQYTYYPNIGANINGEVPKHSTVSRVYNLINYNSQHSNSTATSLDSIRIIDPQNRTWTPFEPVTTEEFLNSYENDYIVYRDFKTYTETFGDLTVTLQGGDRVHSDDNANFDIEITGPNGFKQILSMVEFGDSKTFNGVLSGDYTAKVINLENGNPYVEETKNPTVTVTENSSSEIIVVVNANWTAVVSYARTKDAWINLSTLYSSDIVVYFNDDVTKDAKANRGTIAIKTTEALNTITTLETIACHKVDDNSFKPISKEDFKNAWASGYRISQEMYFDTDCYGEYYIRVLNGKTFNVKDNINFSIYGNDISGADVLLSNEIVITEDGKDVLYTIKDIDISGDTKYSSYKIVPSKESYTYNGYEYRLSTVYLAELGMSFTTNDLRERYTHGTNECGIHTSVKKGDGDGKNEPDVTIIDINSNGRVIVNVEFADYIKNGNDLKENLSFDVGDNQFTNKSFGMSISKEEGIHKVKLNLNSLENTKYFIEDVSVNSIDNTNSIVNDDMTVDVSFNQNQTTEITYTIGAKGSIELVLERGDNAISNPPQNTQVKVMFNGTEISHSPVTIKEVGSKGIIDNIDLSKNGIYTFEVITTPEAPHYWERIESVTISQLRNAPNNFTETRSVVYNAMYYDFRVEITPQQINVNTRDKFKFGVNVKTIKGEYSATPTLELYWENEKITEPFPVTFDQNTGVASYLFEATAPEETGTYTITGYINYDGKYYEINLSDNINIAKVNVTNDNSDLYLNYVPLNTSLRAGEETVVSFIAHNTGATDVLKEHNVALEAELVYKESYNGSWKTMSIGDNADELKAVVIPSVEKGGENLIYVRFTIPENIYSVQHINAKLNVNANSKWSEENLTNNTAQISIYSLFHPGDSSNPGYMEKALSAPNGYVSKIDTPNLTEYNKYSGVEINGFTITKTIGNKAQWSVWEEQNDKELIARTYGANVYVKSIVKVDNRCLTSKKVNSTVSMKSGYAVTMAVIPNVVTSGFGQHSLDFAVTDCQLATAYFPEVSYNKTEYGKYSILDKIDTASEFNTSQFTSANTSNVGTETHDFPILGDTSRWELPLNTKSNFTAFLQEENASIATQMTRKHFTPLWWKDGAKYEIQTEVSRVWTPSGVIANGDIAKARITTGASSSPVDLIINGSVYDDYYTVR